MKDRIIEMLDRGERVELELADKAGFIEQGASHHVADGLQRGINTVCSVDGDNNVVIRASGLDDILLAQNDCYLKYFKIKEPIYTFNDLIDVVVQAYKDGVIPSLELGSEMGVRSVRCLASAILDEWDDYSNGVNNIKSLYTETFVIESKEDMYRIGDEYEIVLSNGEDIGSIVTISDDTPYFEYDGRLTPVPYAVLKGATVTQKRGNQCNK